MQITRSVFVVLLGISISGFSQKSDILVSDLISLEGEKDVVIHKRLYEDYGKNSDSLILVITQIIKTSPPNWLSGTLLQLKSSLLFKQGRIIESLDAVDRSYKLFKELNDTLHIARYHLIKGDVHTSIKDLERSYFHLRKAIEYYSLANDSSSIALSYLNIGNTFFYDEQYDSAYFYYNEISTLYKKPTSLLGYYQQLNIGNWHLHFKEYKKALKYFYPLENGFQKINYQYGLSFLYSNMAEAYQGIGKTDSSLYFHKKAVIVCKEQKIGIHFINVSKSIASAYKEIGQLDSALYYTELQMQLNDSLLNMRINQEVNQKEAENQLVLHQKNIELKNIELAQASKEMWGMGLILLLLSCGIVILYRNAKKEKETNSALLQTNLQLANTQEALKKASVLNIEKAVAPILRKEFNPISSIKIIEESPEKINKRKLLIEELEQLINDGIYRKNDLTLDTLSKKLKTNRTYLSESINKTYGKNFNSFLNEHRINEARQVLLNNDINYTIEAISQMVGFKSISVFNTAFKKQTGLTPSYFEKNAKTLDV